MCPTAVSSVSSEKETEKEAFERRLKESQRVEERVKLVASSSEFLNELKQVGIPSEGRCSLQYHAYRNCTVYLEARTLAVSGKVFLSVCVATSMARLLQAQA